MANKHKSNSGDAENTSAPALALETETAPGPVIDGAIDQFVSADTSAGTTATTFPPPSNHCGVILPIAADLDTAGQPHVRDGRRRVMAAIKAEEETVPVAVNGQLLYLPPNALIIDGAVDSRDGETYNDADFKALVQSIKTVRELRSGPDAGKPETALLIAFHANNNSKPETPADFLKVVRGLKAQGMGNSAIARMLRKSPAWVTGYVAMLNQVPEEIQGKIGEHITTAAMLEVLRPETAPEKREEVFEQLRSGKVVEDAEVAAGADAEPGSEGAAAEEAPADGKKKKGRKAGGKSGKSKKISKKDVVAAEPATMPMKELREILARNAGEVEPLEKEDAVFGQVCKNVLLLLGHNGKSISEKVWKNRTKMLLKAKLG